MTEETDKNGLPIDIQVHEGMLPSWTWVDPYWHVHCQVEFPEDPHIKVRFEYLTKRGSTMHIHDFYYQDECLWFCISTPQHISWVDVFPDVSETSKVIAQTFIDFSWWVGDGSTPENIIEVRTKIKESDSHGRTIIPGDLTQVIPGKVCDDMLDCLAKMNWGPLEGIMQEAILYGPFITRR